jgi:hypothetical protein
MLTEVMATRYVTPLREGGSLPGIVEADNLGTYVTKFIGAGQGRKTLVAEVVAGELARRLGLRVPDLVRVVLDPVIGLGEPDEEVQDLLKRSGGLNLGMDYLPGSLGFDPLAFEVDPEEAGRVIWFDGLVGNVDRSWRNPNMLVWHGDLWLIDHGATLIWHHNWPTASASAGKPYDIADHALAVVPPGASGAEASAAAPDVPAAHRALAPLVTEELLREVVALVPDEWISEEPGFEGPDAVRDAYVERLLARIEAAPAWLPDLSGERPRAERPRPANAPGWLTGRRGS